MLDHVEAAPSPLPSPPLARIQQAIGLMRAASKLLRKAKAKRAAAAVRRAVKSAEGAERRATTLEARFGGARSA
jgi:hypothetical protein